jgi:hypothetical protein
LRIVGGPTMSDNALTVRVRATGTGKANVFAWGSNRIVGAGNVAFTNTRVTSITWQLDDTAREALQSGGMVLIGFEADRGGTTSLAAPISTGR